MRAGIRFLLLLVASLALVAWGASALFNRQAMAWADRDTGMRARLAASAAAPSLRGGRRAPPPASCSTPWSATSGSWAPPCACVTARPRWPATASRPSLGCHALSSEARATGDEGWDGTAATRSRGRPPHGDPHRHGEPEQPRLLLLVHDMSFVDRRADTTRLYTFLAFALVGLLGAAAASVVARLSWLSWTTQLRTVLLAPFRAMETATPRRFQPLLSDVRDLVSSLAVEEARSETGWTPDRLQQVLRRQLGGEGILVVANREPYIHERDGAGRAAGGAPGLGPGHRARAGHARLLGHLDRPRQRQRRLRRRRRPGSRPGPARAARLRPAPPPALPARRSRATTTASPTRGSGRSATWPTPARSSAPGTGSSTSR